LSPYKGNSMSARSNSNKKSLKQTCWQFGTNVSALCRELGIARQTAYDAWRNPSLCPLAALKIAEHFAKHETKTH